MKVIELYRLLATEIRAGNHQKDILLSSDEEMNELYQEWEMALLEEEDKFVFFGHSGTELE